MSKKINQIKVLNIAQPNAHYIFHDGKNVENRAMPSYLRGTIAIYASATKRPRWIEQSGYSENDMNFGAIIGFVDIVDCITEKEITKNTKKWFSGEFGYVLKNARLLKKPVYVRPPSGAVTWWTLKGLKAEQCLNQIKSNTFIAPSVISPKDRKNYQTKKNSLWVPSKALAKIIGSDERKLNILFKDFINYINKNNLGFKVEKEIYIKADKLLKPLFKSKEVHDDELWNLVERNSRIVEK